MAVIVKICGITRPEDGLAAAEAGANALGLVFCEASPRCVSLARSEEIARRLPPFIVKVGVFVNPTAELVLNAIAACGLNLLQFHGEEPPEFCGQFGLLSMKAFRLRDAASLEQLSAYPTGAWLLDAYSPKAHGGVGETFNWEWAIAARKLGRPILLAGGLTPLNVGEAVRQVRPWGVDVSSGVESAPGRKDPIKVRAFIEAAREAE